MSETDRVPGYPIAAAISPEKLEAETAELERLGSRPAWARFAGYLKLGGPGFLDAAL